MIINESTPQAASHGKVINPFNILINIILYILCGIAIAILYFVVEPNERVILCDDPSIRYPYEADIVSNAALMSTAILVPLLIIFLVEVAILWKKKARVGTPSDEHGTVTVEMCGKDDICTGQTRVYLGKREIHPLSYYIPKHMMTFCIGFMVCVILTLVGKKTMGQLRPHFLDVCKPDCNLAHCTTQHYFNVSVCQGDPDALKEARQSFPSGHASVSAYAAIFAILYLQRRAVWPSSPNMGRGLIVPVLQWSLVACALFTGLSRVADNHHRLVDVACGWILGVLVAMAFSGVFDWWRRKTDHSISSYFGV